MAGSLGGRPKADIWEHVEILDDKRVKCKYCGLAFAKSANRIKSHVSQTEGKGIRICPQFPQPNTNSNKTLNNNISSSSLQENLIGSQGSRILNRPRDHNELNENMLDCYMSPKTMWEGITQQHVQIDTKTEQHEMKQVGPFTVSKMMDACDLQLIEYVFDHSLDKSEIVFSSSDSYLDRNEFITLKPQSLLNSMIINIFAEYSTDIERKKRSSNLNWYLPITFSTSALTSDVKSFLSFVERQQMREKYMSKLVDCEKIFIPIHTDKGCGHFYLYVIHLKTKEIEIWDSSPSLTNEEEHREKTQKLLLAFTILFVDDMWDSGRKISYFQRIVVKDTPSQLNEYDCGIFLINFMQQSANANRNHSPQLFHSDEERLDLALKLLKSHLNKEREKLYYKAMKRHLPMDKNLSGLKRKGIDVCGGFPKDVQTQEYTILVQNHIGEIGVQENLDISNFEAGLTQDLLGESNAAHLSNSAETPNYSFSSLYPWLSDDWDELPLGKEDSEDMLVYRVLDMSAAVKKDGSETAAKRARNETPSSLPAFKVRKEKMGDRIIALQQLVSPFGKTDTASLLSEAIEYIKFLHEQISVLNTPYMKSGAPMQHRQTFGKSKEPEGPKRDIRSRGLCLVPVSSTFPVTYETTVDFWTPTFGATFR